MRNMRLLSFQQHSSDTLGITREAGSRVQAIKNLTRTSEYCDEHVSRITLDELEVGPLISIKGSFSQIRRVRLLDSEDSKSYALKEPRTTPPGGINNDNDDDDGNNSKLLLRRKTAAVDLGLEAQILSRIRHPHVVTLQAVPPGQLSRLLKNGKLFLLLDFLDETLDKRIERWRASTTKHGSSSSGSANIFARSSRNNNKSRQQQLADRLESVALPVVDAMEHLHALNIIYRDLKPANLGFDPENGLIKLFDFSFARECIDEEESSRSSNRHPDYRMTGKVGTPRYMAPEVALCRNYGFPADV